MPLMLLLLSLFPLLVTLSCTDTYEFAIKR